MRSRAHTAPLTLTLCFTALPVVSFANIPAAYLACEGADEGAPCSLPGPQYGVCVRDTLCEDPQETSVNECVICVDECWAGQDGQECVRPWTGELGVCESQDRCTDKVETSFEECRRCVEGTPWLGLEQQDDLDGSSCVTQARSSSANWYIFWWLQVMICLMIHLHRSGARQNQG